MKFFISSADTSGKATGNAAINLGFHKFHEDCKDFGMTPSTALKFMICHEVVGLSVMMGCWTACYYGRPVKHLMDRSLTASSRTLQWAESKVNKLEGLMTRIPFLGRISDPGRFTLSLVESTLLRKICHPVLLPAKIVVVGAVFTSFGLFPKLVWINENKQ